jgi:CMP-N-acetylneuraminic acid synthetase
MVANNLKSLAVIPARGGSKRFRKKNIAKLNGKPLICYTIESAIQSQCFDHIIFSSDDDEILNEAKNYSEITIKKHSEKLSGDKVKVIELIIQILGRQDLKDKFDTITLLLPTCPLRRASDIKQGFKLLNKKIDSVVSVTEFEFPIKMSLELKNNSNTLKYIFDPSPLVTGNTRSQDHKPIFRPNGAFYISWWNKLQKNENYFKGKVKGHAMPREHSVDIDNQTDLLYAEILLKHNFIKLDY